MARTSTLLLLGAAAALLLLAAAAPAAAEELKCKSGCAECVALTPEEVAAKKAAKEERRAAWAAKKEAEGVATTGEGRRGGHWGKGGNWTMTRCTKCVDEISYKLEEGRCLCTDGFGLPLPPLPVNGVRPPRPATMPTCARCPPGTASGPAAPAVDWSAYKKEWAAARGAGGRHLLGMGWKKAVFCVPCPSGNSAEDRKSCL